MHPTTFFWHDYETFGVQPRRDRPAQFAGLRTDAELNELGDELSLFCQPAPDFLPDPESCLITGLLPQTCLEQGLPEHAFAAAIEGALARPGTVGVGYNTIRFDDEVTRHLFWRNLRDPYAREWQNDCGRWDLIDVVRCTWALRPEGIEWPTVPDGPMAGRPSFRLEHLSAANGLVHDAAHEAMSDVRATLALARLIRAHQPRLFDFCLRLRRKDAVVAEIGIGRPFLHISGMYGAERGFMAVVWPLAPHPTNKNELLVWDLAHDPGALMSLNAAQVRERLFTPKADMPEGMERLPIKSIHINRSPIVISSLKTLSPAMAERWGVDMALCLKHAEVAASQTHRLHGLWPEVYAGEAPRGPVDVDEDLYGGFIGNTDRRTLERLRQLPPERLAEQHPHFEDPRLEELVWRYRARNFPASLNADDQARWMAHRVQRLHEGSEHTLNLATFEERVETLHTRLDQQVETGAINVEAFDRAQALLEALIDYAQAIAPELP